MPTQVINSSRQGTPLVALRPGSGTNPRLVNGPHGLSARPDWVSISLKCKLADRGFSVGDTAISPRGENPIAWADDTNLYVAFSVNGQWVTSKTGANAQRINEDRWDWTITPYLIETVNALTSIDASEVIGVLDTAPVDADRGKAWIIDPTDRTKIALKALLTVSDIDGRIEAWARSGNTDGFPVAKILAAIQGTRTTADRGKLVAVSGTDEDALGLVDAPVPRTDAEIDARTEDWAHKDDTNLIPAAKLPAYPVVPTDSQIGSKAVKNIPDNLTSTEKDTATSRLGAAKASEVHTGAQIDARADARIVEGVEPWARDDSTEIPAGKMGRAPQNVPAPPARKATAQRYEYLVPAEGDPSLPRWVEASAGGGGGGGGNSQAVTPAEVRARLSVARGLEDAPLQSAINAADAQIRSWLGFSPEGGSTEVTVDGGMSALYLPRPRQNSGASIVVVQQARDAGEDRVVPSDQWSYRDGPPRIVNHNGWWYPGTYRVTYDAASIESVADEVMVRLIGIRLVDDGLLKVEDAEYREWRRYTDPVQLQRELMSELPINPMII